MRGELVRAAERFFGNGEETGDAVVVTPRADQEQFTAWRDHKAPRRQATGRLRHHTYASTSHFATRRRRPSGDAFPVVDFTNGSA